jgi:hypothetical protein
MEKKNWCVLDKKNQTYTVDWRPNDIQKYYTKKDLEKFKDIVDEARNLWQNLMYEYHSIHGDVGTCIIGNGIKVTYLAPKCRIPKDMKIISPRGYQGSLVMDTTASKIVEFLKSKGIECYYDSGSMD